MSRRKKRTSDVTTEKKPTDVTTAMMVPPFVLLPKKKIFVSWSGDRSKQIAVGLKIVMENIIFPGTGLECFVSDVSIESGEDWWNRIKEELKECNMGIVCITKENIMAPWIYFESGALVARDLLLKPLLFNCSMASLSGTPIRNKHMVDFYDQDKFELMMHSINKRLKLREVDSKVLDDAIRAGYETMKKNLSKPLSELKKTRIFNEKYVYPKDINTVNLDTLYISASMSSLTDEEYKELREFLIELVPILKEKCNFTSVYSPILEIEKKEDFDGNMKAIGDNFPKMKQAESILVIYPKYEPSSVLLEIGYGIALCKNTVVFYQEKLPYMLEESAASIEHVGTWKYKTLKDIKNYVKRNGCQLFKMGRKETA